MAAQPLLAVDGDNLAHRAWHALPKSIKGGDGQPGNVIVGFLNMLLSVWETERPRTVFVGFDSVGVPTYRNELLPAYQSGREFPKELTNQLDRLPALVEALGFAWAKEAGYEADDFLAAAVAGEEERGGTALVHPTDEHPERPERLALLQEAFPAFEEPRRATVEELALCHDRDYIDRVRATSESGKTVMLDPDT